MSHISTHSLTHSHAHSLTHSHTHSLTHTLTHTLTHAHTTHVQALEAISVAGVLQDDIGKFCYCMRSKCYLQIGQHDEALQDAEAALNIDKDLIKVRLTNPRALLESTCCFAQALLVWCAAPLTNLFSLHLLPVCAIRESMQKRRRCTSRATLSLRCCIITLATRCGQT